MDQHKQWQTSECDLESLFARFGSVSAVKIISDRAGVPKGYGFITYETEEEAKRVLREGDNLVLKGRKLNVAIAIKKQQVGRIESSHGYPGMNGAATYSIFPTSNGLTPFNPYEAAAYYTDPTTAAAIYSSFAPGLTSPLTTHHPSGHPLSGGHLGGHCPSTHPSLGPPAPIPQPGTGHHPSPYHPHPAALFYTPHPHLTFIAQPPPPPGSSYGSSSGGHGQVTGITVNPNNGSSGGGQVYHTHHGASSSSGHLTSSPIPGQGQNGAPPQQIQSWGQPHYLTTTGQVMVNNPMNHVS